MCLDDNLETIADTCFLLSSYVRVDWIKNLGRIILDIIIFACQSHRSCRGHFS